MQKIKEEYIAAIQNVGAVIFIIGIFGCCMAADVVTFILCFTIVMIGVLLLAVAEHLVDKLEQREKNKCHRTTKHIDTYH